jgi:hypothetical protein
VAPLADAAMLAFSCCGCYQSRVIFKMARACLEDRAKETLLSRGLPGWVLPSDCAASAV